MRIAIVGAGISGLTAAWLLSDKNEIVLYEANDYVGGHTHTVDVETGGKFYAVDTGFIVFNEKTYPNFCKILKSCGVEWQPSRMDFSVKSQIDGMEFNARTLGTLFSQTRNLFSFSFLKMFYEALKLGKELDRILEDESGEMEIDKYLENKGYSRRFIEQLIIPMGASLWSSDPEKMRNFPVKNFVRFFKNHGFLAGKKPQWLVVKGGSRNYIPGITQKFKNSIRLNSPVKKVVRFEDRVGIMTLDGEKEFFDGVVLALHSDQAVKILDEPTEREREILGALPYLDNDVYLHTDTSILPSKKPLWASWNYMIPKEKRDRVAVTYDMNILQTLDATEEFCVSLNYLDCINTEKIIRKFVYAHPQYDPGAIEAQKRFDEINGFKRTYYCGAYWGYGFHEDGVRSAIAACEKLGVKMP